MTDADDAELRRLREENALLQRELAETNRGVIALHAELESHARRLAEADERKNEFLAVLAHELRNPLAVIRLALDELSTGPNVERLQRQADHMSRLVDDLLDVSRVVRQKISLAREPVELTALLRQTVQDRHAVLTSEGHRVDLDLPAEPVWVDGDIERLSQVFGNLLHNAVKYSPAGTRVRLSIAHDDGEVEVLVEDEGRGLTPEEQSQIFELFVQTGHSIDRQGAGLGIGLTLVRQLVRLHEGEVRVASAGPGQGSTFSVRLPRGRPPRVAAPSAAPEVPVPAGKRILLVEDGEDLRELLASRLRRRQLVVDTAEDGASALARYVEQGPYDAVVTDIGLPGMSGYDLAEALRERDASVLLVALTGYGTSDDRARSDHAGFDHHLVKPVDLDALMKAIGGADARQNSES